MRPSGIRVRGRRSTPGRYFQVAEPGTGWGGTNISEPLDIIEKIDTKVAWPGLRLPMVSTTGEHPAWLEPDADLKPRAAELPAAVRTEVDRPGQDCEPALASGQSLAGAGRSPRARAARHPGPANRPA